MEAVEQARRWANAKEKWQAAQLCNDHQLYGDSLTRSYYWRHGGVINEFCRGRWTTPILLPTALAALRKRLETLYRMRIAVDYAAASVSHDKAEFGLAVVQEVFDMIARHTGRAL
jgi:hypothetical protein